MSLNHCLQQMTNHVHLLCRVQAVPLSKIMQNVSFRYARWINWSRSKCGHVFQGRYKAILLDRDEYLLQLLSYIHLNPVRAGIVQEPGSYLWSSHRAYIGKEEIPWLATTEILGYFGKSPAKARCAFDRFVRDRIKEGHRTEFGSGSKTDHRVLGEEDFVESVLTESEVEPAKPTIGQIIEAVEGLYGVNQGELARKGKSFRVAEARTMAAWAVRDLARGTLTELSKMVGRDPTTLSNAIRRLQERAKRDEKLAKAQADLRELL